MRICGIVKLIYVEKINTAQKIINITITLIILIYNHKVNNNRCLNYPNKKQIKTHSLLLFFILLLLLLLLIVFANMSNIYNKELMVRTKEEVCFLLNLPFKLTEHLYMIKLIG